MTGGDPPLPPSRSYQSWQGRPYRRRAAPVAARNGWVSRRPRTPPLPSSLRPRHSRGGPPKHHRHQPQPPPPLSQSHPLPSSHHNYGPPSLSRNLQSRLRTSPRSPASSLRADGPLLRPEHPPYRGEPGPSHRVDSLERNGYRPNEQFDQGNHRGSDFDPAPSWGSTNKMRGSPASFRSEHHRPHWDHHVPYRGEPGPLVRADTGSHGDDGEARRGLPGTSPVRAEPPPSNTSWYHRASKIHKAGKPKKRRHGPPLPAPLRFAGHPSSKPESPILSRVGYASGSDRGAASSRSDQPSPLCGSRSAPAASLSSKQRGHLESRTCVDSGSISRLSAGQDEPFRRSESKSRVPSANAEGPPNVKTTPTANAEKEGRSVSAANSVMRESLALVHRAGPEGGAPDSAHKKVIFPRSGTLRDVENVAHAGELRAVREGRVSSAQRFVPSKRLASEAFTGCDPSTSGRSPLPSPAKRVVVPVARNSTKPVEAPVKPEEELNFCGQAPKRIRESGVLSPSASDAGQNRTTRGVLRDPASNDRRPNDAREANSQPARSSANHTLSTADCEDGQARTHGEERIAARNTSVHQPARQLTLESGSGASVKSLERNISRDFSGEGTAATRITLEGLSKNYGGRRQGYNGGASKFGEGSSPEEVQPSPLKVGVASHEDVVRARTTNEPANSLVPGRCGKATNLSISPSTGAIEDAERSNHQEVVVPQRTRATEASQEGGGTVIRKHQSADGSPVLRNYDETVLATDKNKHVGKAVGAPPSQPIPTFSAVTRKSRSVLGAVASDTSPMARSEKVAVSIPTKPRTVRLSSSVPNTYKALEANVSSVPVAAQDPGASPGSTPSKTRKPEPSLLFDDRVGPSRRKLGSAFANAAIPWSRAVPSLPAMSQQHQDCAGGVATKGDSAEDNQSMCVTGPKPPRSAVLAAGSKARPSVGAQSAAASTQELQRLPAGVTSVGLCKKATSFGEGGDLEVLKGSWKTSSDYHNVPTGSQSRGGSFASGHAASTPLLTSKALKSPSLNLSDADAFSVARGPLQYLSRPSSLPTIGSVESSHQPVAESHARKPNMYVKQIHECEEKLSIVKRKLYELRSTKSRVVKPVVQAGNDGLCRTPRSEVNPLKSGLAEIIAQAADTKAQIARLPSIEPVHSALRLVIVRNRSVASAACAELRLLCSNPEEGLHEQASGEDICVQQPSSGVRSKVAEALRARGEAAVARKLALRQQYADLQEAWRRRLKSSRDKKSKEKREAIKERDRYLLISTKGHSALLTSRTSSGRMSTKLFPSLSMSGQVNGTAEVDAVLAEIVAQGGTPGLRDIWSKTLATIPDQNTNYFPGYSSSVRVEDPLASHHLSRATNPWSFQETLIFLEKYAVYPKNFRKIAKFLEHKSTRECGLFYYASKLDFGLKQLAKEASTLKRKGLLKTHIVEIAKRKLPCTSHEDIEAVTKSFLTFPTGLAGGVSSERNHMLAETSIARSGPSDLARGQKCLSLPAIGWKKRILTEVMDMDVSDVDLGQFIKALSLFGASWRDISIHMDLPGKSSTHYRAFLKRNEQELLDEGRLKEIPTNFTIGKSATPSLGNMPRTSPRTSPRLSPRASMRGSRRLSPKDCGKPSILLPGIKHANDTDCVNLEPEHITLSVRKGGEQMCSKISDDRKLNLSKNVDSGMTVASERPGTDARRLPEAKKEHPLNVDVEARKSKTSSWTVDECDKFKHLFKMYGRDWKQIASRMPPKTPTQVKGYWRTVAREVGDGLPSDSVRIAKGEKKKANKAVSTERPIRHAKSCRDEEGESSPEANVALVRNGSQCAESAKCEVRAENDEVGEPVNGSNNRLDSTEGTANSRISVNAFRKRPDKVVSSKSTVSFNEMSGEDARHAGSAPASKLDFVRQRANSRVPLLRSAPVPIPRSKPVSGVLMPPHDAPGRRHDDTNVFDSKHVGVVSAGLTSGLRDSELQRTDVSPGMLELLGQRLSSAADGGKRGD